MRHSGPGTSGRALSNSWKNQLNEFLESYMKDGARIIVDACDKHQVLDAWRKLADRGHSLREGHVNEMRFRAYGLRVEVSVKDLEKSIHAWETDLRLFSDVMGETFSETIRRLGLINMCPERLRKFL